MQTMQPALKNGRNVWDHVNMPESEFEGRVERIRQEMKRSGIDLLLLYGRCFDEYADPCYVSNFVVRLPRGTLCVVPMQGPVVLFFEGTSRGLPSLSVTTCVKELKPGNDAAKDCAKYLKTSGLVPCTVGLGRVEQFMPEGQFRSLREAFSGCKLVDATHIVSGLRMVKSERECDQVRRAARIVKKCFNHIGLSVLERMNEHFLDAVLRREARLEGVGDFRMLVARPAEEDCTLRPPENREIKPGSPFIIHVAVEFERYWAEGVRTFVSDKASLAEVPAAKREFYELALAAIKPGMDVTEAYRDILTAARRSAGELILNQGTGGGIGLSPEEPPEFNEACKEGIENGMCLTLHLAAKDELYGAVMFGETVIVHQEGIEVVTA